MSRSKSRKLIHRCAVTRDPRLWEEFLDRFGLRMRNGLKRALRRSGARLADGELEDLYQEVLCKLLDQDRRRLAGCRATEERSIGAYLGRVAESVVFDHLRSKGAVKRGRRVLVRPRRSVSQIAERAVDPAASPEERLLARERRRAFLARCREVVGPRSPRRDLEVLYLAFLEGLSSREISRRVGRGLTPSSVDSLVHRIKRRMRARGVRIPRRT